MTTDLNEQIKLSDIIEQHGRDLRDRIDAAQKIPGTAGIKQADAILRKLMKLSRQAKSVGYELDGSRKPQTKLAELRETLRQAGRDA